MNNRLLFLLAVSVFLLPGKAPAQVPSGYHYERTVLGPGGGVYTEQRQGSVMAGPFGAAGGMTRDAYYTAPSGENIQYHERGGGVVGPLGGMRGVSSSYLRYENADQSFTYSRFSGSSTAAGPYLGPYGAVGAYGAVGGYGAVRAYGAVGGYGAVGPYGAVGYRRSRMVVWP
jgi:hypothetical protein